MPRYTFSEEDRRKGGKTTSSKYDMRARGRLGLIALANRHFDGDVKKAGLGLSRMGLIVTDPVPRNGAWRKFYELPASLLAAFWGHCEIDDPDGVPF